MLNNSLGHCTPMSCTNNSHKYRTYTHLFTDSSYSSLESFHIEVCRILFKLRQPANQKLILLYTCQIMHI